LIASIAYGNMDDLMAIQQICTEVV